MSYATLILKEGIKQNYLIVVKPKRRQSSWTNIAGNLNKAEFDFGHVIKVTADGVELTEGSTTTPSTDEWYFDTSDDFLYINVASIATTFITVFYELYFSTLAAHWYRIPTDNTSRMVYYDPIVISPPSFRADLSDSIIGVLPAQGSVIRLNNAEHTLEKHLYDSSFKNCDIDVWHWLDNLAVANIKKRFIGIGGNPDYNETTVSLVLRDRIDIFEKEFRSSVEFYEAATFTNLDPAEEGRPVRTVFGVVNELVCTNLDYETDNPTTSENRIWGVRAGSTNQGAGTVLASPASTNTRTYLDDVEGFVTGDNVYLDKSTDEYPIVTAVGANYIEHAALSSGACAGGDLATRPTVAWVKIEQGGVQFRALYDRDYTESSSNGVLQITFVAGLEVNLGMETMDGTETVFCRVYGKLNDNTIGGSPFGSDSATYLALTDPAVILYDLIRDVVAEADINTDSFSDLSTDISTEDVGFAIPPNKEDDYPKYKDIIAKLIINSLIQIYVDNDLKWEVSRLEPIVSEDVSIENDEIIDNSVRYTFDYKDLASEILVQYNYREFSTAFTRATAQSETGLYLHEINKQKEFQSLLIESTDADKLAERLSFIYGDRQGRITIIAKNRFQQNNIADIINITRTKLPGYEFDEDTERNRDFEIHEIDKGLDQVTMICNDNKGLDDNSGDY